MRPTVLLDWRIALVLGVRPKVDEPCRQALQEAVEQAPRSVGQPFSIWTCRDLAHYIAEQGHALVSAETIRRHLHDLQYCLLRPVLSIGSPDPDYASKVQQLEQLKDQARRGEIILLFEDEVDLNLLPGVIRCWTQRGTQCKVPTPGQNQKRYGFGAVDFVSGQVLHHIHEHKDSDGFCALVEQIVQHYCPDESWRGPPVVLVVDNYTIHSSKKTQQVLDKYAGRLAVMALPTYSPHLNLIERLWKHLRRRVTHNHMFQSIASLIDAVEQFFCYLDSHLAETLSIIGAPD
jgi:hypothetical protein